jgi:hypothetical protein
MPRETQFYGVSPMHPLLDPQRDYNEGREQLREHRRRHTQPRTTLDPRYPISPNDWSNRDFPLQVPPGAMQYLIPPPLGREVIEALLMAASDMEDISGIHDVSRGQRVPQLTAGVAIEALQQKAETRVNARLPLLADTYREMARHMLYNFVVHSGIAGLMRLAGQSDPDLTRIPFDELINSTGDVLDFDVDVVVGSSSSAKIQDETNAVLLAQAGIIDAEAVLEKLKWPRRHRILERVAKKAQQEQAIQLAGAVGPTGEPPDPYSNESVAGAQGPSDLPPELQEVLKAVEAELGSEVAAAAFRGIQTDRRTAVAEHQGGRA